MNPQAVQVYLDDMRASRHAVFSAFESGKTSGWRGGVLSSFLKGVPLVERYVAARYGATQTMFNAGIPVMLRGNCGRGWATVDIDPVL